MSRHTENREEILKIHGSIDLINQRIRHYRKQSPSSYAKRYR